MIYFKGSDLCFAGHRIRFMPEDLEPCGKKLSKDLEEKSDDEEEEI